MLFYQLKEHTKPQNLKIFLPWCKTDAETCSQETCFFGKTQFCATFTERPEQKDTAAPPPQFDRQVMSAENTAEMNTDGDFLKMRIADYGMALLHSSPLRICVWCMCVCGCDLRSGMLNVMFLIL